MASIPIIFEDDDILVINKPAGLVVDRSQTQVSQTLEDILKSEFHIKVDRGGIVHRLDKDTSGVILVAKTTQSLEVLQAQFKDRTTKKEYLALVHGSLEKPGAVTGPIMRNPKAREKFIVGEAGKEAVTKYEPVQHLEMSENKITEIFPDYSKIQLKKLLTTHYSLFTLLKCLPETGRTHQIRVHLKHIGFPIVGDEKYAGRKTSRLDRRWCPRQFLHAAKLEFTHPRSGEKMIFESLLPGDLEEALKKLEKRNS